MTWNLYLPIISLKNGLYMKTQKIFTHTSWETLICKTVISKVRQLSRDGAKPDLRPTTFIITIVRETNSLS